MSEFHKFYLPFFLALLILTGCNLSSPPPSTAKWIAISGRDDGKSTDRPFLYQALVPHHWERKDPQPNDSIADTTKANCEFCIKEGDEEVRITFHTFPIQDEGKRIPPQAQIARWKKQLENLDLLSVQVIPDSHGGFSLFFEAEGDLKGNRTKVMGWSMQLAPAYLRHLSLEKQPLDKSKRADYTLKATGPPTLIHKHHLDIMQFATSFELIDELPFPHD